MPDWRALFVSGVTGHRPDGALAATVTAQAEQMFANVESALHASHMNWQNVARTWIYLDRLLDWYGEFNRVRSSFFASRGVTADRPGHAFPASTGVGCRMGGAECCMDVLAVAAELDSSVQLRPLQRSVRQEPPARYGSAFSRGMSLRVEGRQTIFVSGTASIGPDGRTRHTDSVEAQINETMLNLAALPQTVGAGLSDITSATLFCKEAATLPLFESMVELLGVPRFPYVPVVADICRPDLAFEIEAVAVAS
jgi:enamine deaminase RidA (YjgF/YER057c/UK114 family)